MPNTDQFQDWFRRFLNKRGLSQPNGQMLFQYRVSGPEYLMLRNLFNTHFRMLRGRPYRFGSTAECALFVLYAAEWWRREYAGGAWRWTSIFASLTDGIRYQMDVFERSVAVERGIRAWGHRTSEDGKKYLGAIVAHGGLPLKMVAQGDGAMARLLLSATRKAQLLGWSEQHLMAYFEVHAQDLSIHLRAAEIYRLLAGMVDTVLTLRRTHALVGLIHPVEVLNHKEPKWRERFPISIDDDSMEPLLVGLVREVARAVKTQTSHPVSAVRSLVKLNETNDHALSMTVQMPRAIALDALAAAVGVPESLIPLSFALEIIGTQRISLGQGRQILGEENHSSVLLTGAPRRFLGQKATEEVLLVLRSRGKDIGPPSSVFGGEQLDSQQPWCFVDIQDTWTWVAVGSCKVPNELVMVVAPPDSEWVTADGATVDRVGQILDLDGEHHLYKVTGQARVGVHGDWYSIQTGALKVSEEIFNWKGDRFFNKVASLPVFKGVPELYRMDAEGASFPVSLKQIEWVHPIRQGTRIYDLRYHSGPIDAWYVVEGVRQRRFRMVILSETASVGFKSGANECEGRIEFNAWGNLSSLQAPSTLAPQCIPKPNGMTLALKAETQPPASLELLAQWHPAHPLLRFELPFPVAGGRFFSVTRGILPNKCSLSVKDIQALSVQVFDRTPHTPKQYRLVLALKNNADTQKLPSTHLNVPIDNQGVGEIRFFEIEARLNALLSQSDHLDAILEVSLCAGPTVIKMLKLSRYEVELERYGAVMQLPASVVSNSSQEQLEKIHIQAVPLLEISSQPVDLEQRQNDGMLNGCWNAATLTGGKPWLIYSSDDSGLLVRPSLWFAPSNGDSDAIVHAAPCELAEAMNNPSPKDRIQSLHKVIDIMANDLEHPSWKLLIHQYQQLKHLPLNTLDYWRVLGKNLDASLAVLLQLSAADDISTLMKRMRDELGVLWELASAKNLARAYKAAHQSWITQLGALATPLLVHPLLIDVFTKIGGFSPSLAFQTDRLLFQEQGHQGSEFSQLIADSRRNAHDVLQRQWHQDDCLLQQVLLRNHAQTEEIWPEFKLAEKLMRAIEVQAQPSVYKWLVSLGSKLVWNQNDHQRDVVNVPLLLGFFVQVCDAKRWLLAENHMAEIKQIQAFDPMWFDVCLQTGALLAIKAQDSSASKPHAAQPSGVGAVRRVSRVTPNKP